MARTFRWAEQADYDTLGKVMFDSVRSGTSRYTEAQRQAWVPYPRSGAEWNERLAAQDVMVAEEDGEALGFMSLAAAGYVDFAYIRPQAQHSGLFRQMLEQIERRAVSQGQQMLWVQASSMAQPAFSALGFETIASEEVELGGERFRRFRMEKSLTR